MIPVRIEDFRRKQRGIFNAESFLFIIRLLTPFLKTAAKEIKTGLTAIK
jgi:hypothetical protein